MINLQNVILHELDKIKARKKYTVFIILEVLIIVLGLSSFYFIQKRAMQGFDNSLVNFFGSRVDITTLALSVFSGTIFPFYIFTLSADLFSSEFSSKTIRNILLRPANRLSIYIGKSVAILAYIVINLAIVFVTCTFLKIIFGMTLRNEIRNFTAFVFVIIPLIVVVTFSNFIATLVKSSSGAMFVLAFIFFSSGVLSVVSSKFAAVNFLNYLGYYKMIIGTIPFKVLLNSTLLLLSTGIIFFILGFLMFDTMDA